MIGWHQAPEVAWDRKQRLTQYTPDISWGQNMRPRRASRVNRLLVLMGIGALLAAGGMSTARADRIINATEAEYAATYGFSMICENLDTEPTEDMVLTLGAAIMGDGFNADSAVDIINVTVSAYCPRHWPLLQRIGAEARGETGRTLA